MNAIICPACGAENAGIGVGVRSLRQVECANAGCKLYSAKWAALIKPGGEPLYIPPVIGSSRFMAIANELSGKDDGQPAPETAKEPIAKSKEPIAKSSVELRRVVLSKQARSILFENPGTPRMLWVSKEFKPQAFGGTWYRTEDYEFESMPDGIWDLVAFSGNVTGCICEKFEICGRDGYGQILAYNQPMEFFTNPVACIQPLPRNRQQMQVRVDLQIQIPPDIEPRFRVMFWGRALANKPERLQNVFYR